MLNETGFKSPLLLNYTQWANGQTGSVGMFGQNGSTTENYRVLADDPWGKQTVVWEARPDSTSGADGGWNASYVAVDPKYYYRFSIWVRKPVLGNGSTYLGCHGSPAVLSLSSGNSNSNPYFWAGGLPYQDWVLIVGHIHPTGTPAGSAIHSDSGFYRVGQGRIGNTSSDFIFASGTTIARHRSYLYYSTNTATRQQWVYPRMDKCDGTEPSIAELLAGHDSRNIEHRLRIGGSLVQPMSIDSETKVGGISEVGITNGLVAYYPLNKDAKDYSGNGYHGTVTGAVLTGGGFDGTGAYKFDGTGTSDGVVPGAYIDIPENITDTRNYASGVTYSFWLYIDSDSVDRQSLFFGSSTIRHIEIYSSGRYFRTEGGVVNGYSFGSSAFPKEVRGAWSYFTIVFDTGATNKPVRWYQDGVLFSSNQLGTDYFSFNKIGRSTGTTSYIYSKSLDGNFCNFKIFNRALTAEEISVEYKRTGQTKMTQHNGTVYIQGQIKEIV